MAFLGTDGGRSNRWFARSSSGFTFIELVVATAVLIILASAALPIARISIRRQKEAELHRSLREMRTAIDDFKRWADAGRISTLGVNIGSETTMIMLCPSTCAAVVDAPGQVVAGQVSTEMLCVD